MNVVGYVRVSTAEQAESGLGLAAQRRAVKEAAKQRGMTLVRILEDQGISGKSLDRPGLTEALAMVEGGEAEAVVVAKLDRLSRSLLDFASMMERSRRNGWAVVALDLGVDTTTASGALLASVLAGFAEYERRQISDRTKAALAERKAQGVRLGRPPTMAADVVARILAEHQEGKSYGAIARGLDADGVPTAQGGRWYPATVRGAVRLYGEA